MKEKEAKALEAEKSYVSLKNINKIYENKFQAVYDFNLEIAKKEFVVFVGPSGCGKSTTLRMIAGLEDISSGELWIDGTYSNDRAPKDRDIAMVFQSYALYPHMTIYDNMAFGLKIRRLPKSEIDRRVHEAAQILEIEEQLERKPKTLSGGQRQRAALGRAIVRNAKVFLMDEPLSNLDAKLRVQMRSEIIKLHERLGATTIYVTHDQTEAMTMATRIVVMKAGYIQQVGTPLEIYNYPNNLFVASFIGSPPMNFIDVNYEKGSVVFNDGKKITLPADIVKAHDEFFANALVEGNAKLDELNSKRAASEAPDEALDKEIADLQDALASYKGSHRLVFGIRPEDIYEASDENVQKYPGEVYSTKVSVSELLGHEYYVHTDFGGTDMVSKIPAHHLISIHDDLKLVFNKEKLHLFDPRSTKRIY
ncbi:MAG: sn-glycerol-3-phosphate ABC transporter ATP-binding protein UgpC [Epsilonproteobacteria bacterium]|jgi:multiple sugar transport system ATP-binding protein|nr:sn-glycerol-3-phosphate ABC transporter ATP-binding protein UgpC [Candidatus Saccharimonadaceae bacterium]NCA94572.1 sn-glycerol-3-phosphate ABC transporter ATP-binding protein UgpC [Campylobacterota bacterium]HOC81018.1 sn-glycerol-3-phosphate ABC transporter ATP-binding protein UgpC [Bacilli bacterium]HOF54074.1 sn-glycerol-3-phosphate ABC transporter ATP-binding protein UgpC [Bacilli bacterium]HPK68088.1 sn-glycerol-3-phosphate ABC transporter ATP-binding protein UgpC [Bacilli bacterium]